MVETQDAKMYELFKNNSQDVIKVSFRHLSGLYGPTSPTSQFLDGTHEFSELVLAKMALFMDQSRSVLPLRSAKAREFGELWREKLNGRALESDIRKERLFL